MRRLNAGRCAVATVTAAAGLVGCSVLANLSQFDNATVAGLDAQVGDAVDEQRAQAEAGPDDSGNDGSPVGDARSDVLDAGASTLGDSWCKDNVVEASTLYCNDLDEPGNISRWTNINSTPNTTAGLSTDSLSPPYAVVVNTPFLALSTDGGPTAFSQYQFDESVTAPHGVTLRFALRIDNFDQAGPDVSTVRIATQSNSWWVSLDLKPGGADVLETTQDADSGAQSYVNHLCPNPPTTTSDAGAWNIVVLTVDTTANVLTMSYDGTSVLANAPVAPTPGATSWQITIGANYVQAPVKAMTFHYDNILVEQLP